MNKLLLTLMIVCSSTLVYAAYGKSTMKATIKGTAQDSQISGEFVFTQESSFTSQVSVKGFIKNAPPGLHGFHIHENGSCDDMGNAAGGHFNPLKVEHGFMPKDGLNHAHLGDMGNIEVAQDGTGTLKVVLTEVSLVNSQYSIVGKAVILHEKADDFGQPTGNAGGRIGCGIIEEAAETK